MRDAMLVSLTKAAERDPNVMLLTADLGYGVFEKFEERFPKQYLNIGVAEQNMIGVASGLALEGKIIFIYSIGNFPTLRCLEQIRNDACYHNLNINIIASGGGFSYGGLGMSHHATEDIAIMRSLPGVTVFTPCTSWESGEIVSKAVELKGVSYIRLDKSVAEETVKDRTFTVGKAHRLRDGDDFSIIVSGGIAEEALVAAEILEKQKIKCRVVSMSTIKPIDTEEILSACNETKGILTLEENNIVGGLSSAISEVCIDNGSLPKAMIRMGMKDEYSVVVGTQKYLRKHFGLDSDSIINEIKKVL